MSSVIFFINSHNISQCNYSSNFKEIEGDVENGGVSSGHGSINRICFDQQMGLKSSINYNDRYDMEMNADL